MKQSLEPGLVKGLWADETTKCFKQFYAAVVRMSIGRPFGLNVVLIAASASMCHVCHVGGYSEDTHQLESHTYQKVGAKREREGGGSPCLCLISVHGTRCSEQEHRNVFLHTISKACFKKKKSNHYAEGQESKVKPHSPHSGRCGSALRCDHHTSTGPDFLFLIYSHVIKMALEGL